MQDIALKHKACIKIYTITTEEKDLKCKVKRTKSPTKRHIELKIQDIRESQWEIPTMTTVPLAQMHLQKL